MNHENDEFREFAAFLLGYAGLAIIAACVVKPAWIWGLFVLATGGVS